VDHHFWILEEWIKTVAVHTGEGFEDATGVYNGKSLKRVLNEIIQREKEDLDTGEDNSHIGHQLAIFIAVSDKDGKHVYGEESAPEEERTFLPGPKRGDFVECGEVSIGMGDHVGHREVICEEKVLEADGGEKDQDARGHASLACTLDEERVPRFDGEDAADKSVNGTHKRKQKRKTTEYIHRPFALPLS
jgi:hypothetical protein